MGELFDPVGVRGYVGVEDDREWGVAEFARAQALYTRCVYALLHEGRQALEEGDEDLGIAYASVLSSSTVRKLGLNYMNELDKEPWKKQRYLIWPGPWDIERLGPVPFRVYRVEAMASNLPRSVESSAPDCWTFTTAPEGGEAGAEELLPIGLPAKDTRKLYIWSLGADRVSGQPIMGGVQDLSNYQEQKDWRSLGGGDDVNNWDSGASWSEFYNGRDAGGGCFGL